MQYLVLFCATEKQKLRLSGLFAPEHEYTADDVSIYEIPYQVCGTVKELRQCDLTERTLVLGIEMAETAEVKKSNAVIEAVKTSKVAESSKPVEAGVDFTPGMSVNEFLKKNKKIRTVRELVKYFPIAAVKKAELQGLFTISHDKIYF